MAKWIIKRDGKRQKFDIDKIKSAFMKAYNECYKEQSIKEKMDIDWDNIFDEKFKNEDNISVESIQDFIFYETCKHNMFGVAKCFQEYRTRRMVEREKKLEKTYNDIDKIFKSGSNENSNKNSLLIGVKRDLMAGEFFRNKAAEIYPKDVWDAHCKKIIHIHDTDYDPRITNCCLIDIPNMLENGFLINNAEIGDSNSVQTAANVIMQISANVSASQYGGNSIPNFNEILAKYAKMNFRKNFIYVYRLINNVSFASLDKIIEDLENQYGKIDSGNNKLKLSFEKIFDETIQRTDKDIYDACQIFEYQTNSILGSASQTPFSTITMTIPTSWESERVVWNYLKVRQAGISFNKETPKIAIFPKISMIVVDGYNLKEGDKYYYLLEEASRCIAKTYYPDILNYSKEDYESGSTYGRMGCRSRVNHEYRDENGKPAQYGRFNYGVQTLNLVHLCLENIKENGTLETFINKIKNVGYGVMSKMIQARYDNVSKLKTKEAPILFVNGAISRLHPEDTIECLLKSDKASVSFGYIGIDDCVRLITNNEENISTEKGYEVGMEIMNTLVEISGKLKKDLGLPVSLYATPSEASIGTFFEKDKEQFGDIMPKWLLKREYYTNSFHFSSELPIDPFEKIKVESQFTKLSNGGNISYVENGGKIYNWKAIIELIQYSYECGTQYFAVNTISDVCYDCGYIGEMKYNPDIHKYKCPNCGNEDGTRMKVQRRSCGYISNYNITQAVKGRMKEIMNRFIHTK